MQKKIALAYDLGGTKVALGVVLGSGKIIKQTRVLLDFEKGPQGIIEQLAELGRPYLQQYPEIKRIGLASAGPLDPKRGLLLDPTNMFTGAKSWGVIPICSILEKKLKRPVLLENDAAAAALAEAWTGAAKKIKNVMVLTLGTGVGVGVICNGNLLRAGRGLHPEASHIVIGEGDRSAPCGCGNLGCIEAYLSGKNFALRSSKLFLKEDLDSKSIAALARKKNKPALAAFEDYANHLATALASWVVLFTPELVVFTGSFAEAEDLFLEKAKKALVPLLSRRRAGIDLLPRLSLSPLQNSAGLLGAAYVAFFR